MKPKLIVLPPPPSGPGRWTIKHEKFCQLVCEGMKQTDAFLEAGFAAGKNLQWRANDLARQEMVKARIRAIRALHAMRLNVSLERLVLQLEEARVGAMKDMQFQAAINAIVAKAKLLGFLDDARPRNNPMYQNDERGVPKPASEPVEQTEMSLIEWKNRFAPKTTLQ
jgi:hypothetical protein